MEPLGFYLGIIALIHKPRFMPKELSGRGFPPVEVPRNPFDGGFLPVLPDVLKWTAVENQRGACPLRSLELEKGQFWQERWQYMLV